MSRVLRSVSCLRFRAKRPGDEFALISEARPAKDVFRPITSLSGSPSDVLAGANAEIAKSLYYERPAETWAIERAFESLFQHEFQIRFDRYNIAAARRRLARVLAGFGARSVLCALRSDTRLFRGGGCTGADVPDGAMPHVALLTDWQE
jgi:hypothetical protein